MVALIEKEIYTDVCQACIEKVQTESIFNGMNRISKLEVLCGDKPWIKLKKHFWNA